MDITNSIISKVYKKRYIWSHKGNHGKVLVVGGSDEYSGSPALNALAALRSGADLVRIVTPESVAHTVRSYSPDLIVHPLKGKYIVGWHANEILSVQKDCDAMVIGGGMTKHTEVLRAIRKILTETKIPTVIDADALGEHGLTFNKNVIITPHAKEFYNLTGITLGENMFERINAVKQLAISKNCIVLLKGHIDIISDGERVALNKTGNPYMTKGGTGDSLAGIAASLLSRGVDAFDAACAAAYINGKAGDIAANKKEEGMLATDVIKAIPNALKHKSFF